tara:strand:+ start:872 stop:1081 length:210 start_codon:yes stop_codon:yes gene_type:complete
MECDMSERSDATVEELDAEIAELQKRKEAKIKDDKKKAIEEVKNLIATYKISSGDLRGKTMNILNAKKR